MALQEIEKGMMTNKEIIEVVQACEDGEEIQRSRRGQNELWLDVSGVPEWDFPDFDYRVKPNLKFTTENVMFLNHDLSIDSEGDLDVESRVFLSRFSILKIAELIQSDIDNGFIDDPRE